jgi:EAL domain-containing protein (putative c-di-GMP-specific phosphodiesterase class I)
LAGATDPWIVPRFQPAIGRVLIVDDEQPLLRGLGLILDKAGFDVAMASSVATALGVVEAGGVDLVVTDLRMPDSSGLELLGAVRARDAELPVILMTGVPDVDSAAAAIEHGVWRYLTKPIDADKLVTSVTEGVERGRGRRRPSPVGASQLQRALDRLWLAYQPIVSWSQKRIFAFEALVRSDEPGLQGGLLVEAAERLGSIVELGRRVRAAAAATIAVSDGLFFINMHPAELTDAALYDAASPLADHAGRVVFEVTERRSLTEVSELGERLHTLRSMGYRFALDDLGAGYAGLASVADLAPDVIKLDMSLVRGVHANPTRQKLVASMAQLARDLGVPLVAEGVETREERRVLYALGCDLLQGYLFARPARVLPGVAFERLEAESRMMPPVV